MRYRDGRRSLCLSSQSGCPLTCSFCATGQMKFGRNLTASEILDQALHFRRAEAIDHAVFMGMGEPMMNLDNVLAACERLPDLGITHRRTAISTVGWIPGIDALAAQPCRSASRSPCTPPTRRCARRSCRSTTATRWPTCSPPAGASTRPSARMVFVEYVMLGGVNDRHEQAVALAARARPADVQGQPHPLQPDRMYDGSSREAIAALQGGARGARRRRDRAPHPRPRHRRRLRPAGGEGMKLWRSRRAPHVVLLHAGGVDGRMWPRSPSASTACACTSPTCAGTGARRCRRASTRTPTTSCACSTTCRIERATVVGASFGGWVALQLATKAPERVNGAGAAGLDQARSRRLRVVAGDHRLPGAGGRAARGRRHRGRRRPRPARLEAAPRGARPRGGDVARRLRAPAGRRGRRSARCPSTSAPSRSRPSSSPAARTRCPTSPRSPTTSPPSIDGAERAVIKDAGHLIALERPDATAELLKPWLERVSA